MKFIKDLLGEGSDNYLSNPLLIYGFFLQELALLKQAKASDKNLEEFAEATRYKELRNKLRMFLKAAGNLKRDSDCDKELAQVLKQDNRF